MEGAGSSSLNDIFSITRSYNIELLSLERDPKDTRTAKRFVTVRLLVVYVSTHPIHRLIIPTFKRNTDWLKKLFNPRKCTFINGLHAFYFTRCFDDINIFF